MALADLLNLSNKNKKIGLSEERVRAIIPVARHQHRRSLEANQISMKSYKS